MRSEEEGAYPLPTQSLRCDIVIFTVAENIRCGPVVQSAVAAVRSTTRRAAPEGCSVQTPATCPCVAVNNPRLR